MEAVILAGGLGTRLRKVIADLPKPMAPIHGKPFLEIVLKNLKHKGFNRVILSLGFMADKISTYFGHKFEGIELDYVIEETPLGTGGAIKLAMSHSNESHSFVFNGDTFLDLEAQSVEELWQRHNGIIIVGREVPDTERYGRLLISNGLVKGFTEKGLAGPGLINAGCYVFQRDQLRDFPLGQAFSIESDYLTNVVQNTPVHFFQTHGTFIDIGIPEDFAQAQVLLANYL